MPNRCNNTVSITWPADELDKIKKLLKKKWFFNSFYPMPKALKWSDSPSQKKDNETDEQFKTRINKLSEKYWATNRYDWHCIHRWTKWDVASKKIYKQINDKEIYLQFDTARSPPEFAFTKLAELYPKIKIFLEYSEPWMAFSGSIERYDWEPQGYSHWDDPFFWHGKACSKCRCMCDWDNPDDWANEAKTICNRCI